MYRWRDVDQDRKVSAFVGSNNSTRPNRAHHPDVSVQFSPLTDAPDVIALRPPVVAAAGPICRIAEAT
jgi:hypothetical protein